MWLRFDSTVEAMDYGKDVAKMSHRIAVEQCEHLRYQMEKKKQQSDALNRAVKSEPEEGIRKTLINLIIEVSTDHQFLREALEEAEKGIENEDDGRSVQSPR